MEEQKVVVKFCTLLRKSDTEIHSDLVRAYDEILSLRTVQKKAKLFTGRKSTADDTSLIRVDGQ